MEKQVNFNIQAAHKYFAAHCFNGAWDYIDNPKRADNENDTMLALTFASLWHWTQRKDCTATNLSVGYWQVSRVLALLGQPDLARHYGQRCLEASQNEGVLPFYLAYAYEALARAELVAGNRDEMAKHLHTAQQVANSVPDKEAYEQLMKDLESIK